MPFILCNYCNSFLVNLCFITLFTKGDTKSIISSIFFIIIFYLLSHYSISSTTIILFILPFFRFYLPAKEGCPCSGALDFSFCAYNFESHNNSVGLLYPGMDKSRNILQHRFVDFVKPQWFEFFKKNEIPAPQPNCLSAY